MKVLVALIQPEEWNQYIPFNGYISTIKAQYDYVIGVIAEKPMVLLSEVDEYYTVKDGESDFSYPSLLDTSARENNDFIDLCINKIKEDFAEDDLEFISWQNTNHSTGIVNIRDNAANVYRTSFGYAQKWYDLGRLIYPTKKTFDKISNKYKDKLSDDFFIVLSRNYANKAPAHNTKKSIPNFNLLLKFLTENGIKIMNVGFPPYHCSFSNENYIEINDSLTQDELISLFYLSNGVLTQSDAGGFVSHFASNSDFFILTEQWSLPGEFQSFDLLSHKTKKTKTIDLHEYLMDNNFSEILNILKKHKTNVNRIFSEDKKITFVSVPEIDKNIDK